MRHTLTPPLLELDNVESWPEQVRAALDEHLPALRAREFHTNDFRAAQFERAVAAVGAEVELYALRGWHCTRLTDDGIASIETVGLVVPESSFLEARVRVLANAHSITPAIAERLLAEHEARDPARSGKTWFCFQPSSQAGEDGIRRLFGSWGGEALYNSHEDDPETGPVLRSLGIPCLVEADVPISFLDDSFWVTIELARRMMAHCGDPIVEPMRLAGYSVRTVAPPLMRRVIRHPDPEFLRLTGCASWLPPLS